MVWRCRTPSNITQRLCRVVPLKCPAGSLFEYDAVDNSTVNCSRLSLQPNETFTCELLVWPSADMHLHGLPITTEIPCTGQSI